MSHLVFDAARHDVTSTDSNLAVRVAVIEGGDPLLLIARQDGHNNTTSSFNIRNMEEVDLLRKSLDAIALHFTPT